MRCTTACLWVRLIGAARRVRNTLSQIHEATASQEREAFLERSCGSDEDLQRKVEALLKAHGRLGNFLEEPPSGASVD